MASQQYYDVIKNASTFARKADSLNKSMSFVELQQSSHWEGGVSNWGVSYLYALRVICAEAKDVPPLLKSKYDEVDIGEQDSCIQDLVKGPDEDNVTLKTMPELKIVRKYDGRGSLGYVWAALAPLLRPESNVKPTAASEKPERIRSPPVYYAPYVSSQTHIDPLEGRPDSSGSEPSTVGYLLTATAPLVEDYTSRFLNCLIRCVLNYSQTEDKETSFIQYRDERLSYTYETLMKNKVEAIDDGGIEIFDDETRTQVAILEAKRSFQTIPEGGRPTVVDELLSQIVGEALALLRSEEVELSLDHNVISIVAVKHYVKFIHFKITQKYLEKYERLKPSDEAKDLDTFLNLQSTEWFDVSTVKGRKFFVRHLIALIAWADELHG